jgi:hypothetical protein
MQFELGTHGNGLAYSEQMSPLGEKKGESRNKEFRGTANIHWQAILPL